MPVFVILMFLQYVALTVYSFIENVLMGEQYGKGIKYLKKILYVKKSLGLL